MYLSKYHPAFKKDLKNIPVEVILKLQKKIDNVLQNPFAFVKLHGELNEISKTEIKHMGVEYRLAFTVIEDTVVFLMFKKRERFYEYLHRRLK
ncbi:MAG: type II toxin-antitoxin system RelE/ParE family toxin [bacterium]